MEKGPLTLRKFNSSPLKSYLLNRKAITIFQGRAVKLRGCMTFHAKSWLFNNRDPYVMVYEIITT